MYYALLSLIVASATSTTACDAPGDGVVALRKRAAELYAVGDLAAADACVASALVAVTNELEALAAQAQALREFRSVRAQAPTVAPGTTGCVVNAAGASVCLPELAGASSALTAFAPTTVEECGNEDAALSLLASQYDASSGAAIGGGSSSSSSSGGGASEDEAAAAPLDAFIVQSARRHWWGAAKKAVDVLRAQNVPPGAEARRAVTELRDGAGALLALMRQTKMDEATISCAVMWAQGLYSVHLNVKFAGRLDAPVTVLNVDNEVVSISERRVQFSGIGRQKPKRYVLDLELFGAIDANASTWRFGSVGTVSFVLIKAAAGQWERLTAANESVKNHRVWWEKQEQVEQQDRDEKARRDRQEREEAAAQRQAALDAEREEKARLEAAAAAAEREAKAATRALQLPLLDAARAAVDALARAGDDGAPPLDAAKQGVLDAAGALLSHETIGQGGNETARATAESLASAVASLRATGFAELTKDALATAVAQLKEFLEGLVVPEEATEAPKDAKGGADGKKGGKKKAKKKAAKKKA